MSAAAFRIVSFVGLAIVAAGLWVALFRSTGGPAATTPAIPPVGSESIVAAATQPESGLKVRGLVRKGDCGNCAVHVGSGGLVRAEVPSGGGRRTAYALLDIGNIPANGQVLVHDVIGFGRGETPTRRIRLLQALDSSRRVIFVLVAGPDRRLLLTSPAAGLRATPLTLATGAIVPNDGISGVAIDVALKPNEWVRVSVNGVRTVSRRLAGGRTGPPRFLAAGVIGYKASPHAAAITATHAQVSVSTSAATAATTAKPAAQPVQPVHAVGPTAPPLDSLTPPTISGRAVVGATLTAASGSWSDGSATFTYGWERCHANSSCTAIDGALNATYQLTPSDTDAFVRVRVTAHAGDNDVSRTSAPVGPVSPAAPSVLTEPSISGEAIVGSTLTADPGTWSDPDANLAFAWQRCDARGCRTIDGAAGATYTVVAADLGSVLLVEVTASNRGGTNEEDSAPSEVVVPAAPAVVTEPSISGEATVGSTLTADPGTWSDPAATLTYAWLRCHGEGNGSCTAIDGATGTSYVLTSDDEGFRVEFEVTATNAGGNATADSDSLGPIAPAPPVLITSPSISGDATVGSTLTADPGTWSDPAATLTYAWLRCHGNGNGNNCSPISGIDDITYLLIDDDLGFALRIRVTAANAAGTATAESDPTDAVGTADSARR
jgi:hypothetical protein